MIAFLRKNLSGTIPELNSNNVCKSPVYFCLYLKNLSTWSENQPGINHEIYNILVHKHNFAPEFASRVSSKLNRVRDPENAGLVLSFLKENGFSNPRLEKMMKCAPRFVCASLEERIKPKINLFREMGLSSDNILKIISGHPGILELSLKDNIIPKLSSLKRLLGSDEAVARVIRMAPRILPTSLENTVLPNVEFFKSCGVPMERIRIILLNFPTSLLLKPEVVRKSAEKVKEMGTKPSSKSFIYAVPAVASMSEEAWELKLQAFRSLGFSDSDIMTIFRKSPLVFSVSMEKIKKIKELLLGTGKYTVSSIMMYPKSLQFSIEKRFMPRLQILGILESRNLIQKWPPLSTVITLSDDKFFTKFITPYSDKVSDVCIIKNSAGGK